MSFQPALDVIPTVARNKNRSVNARSDNLADGSNPAKSITFIKIIGVIMMLAVLRGKR